MRITLQLSGYRRQRLVRGLAVGFVTAALGLAVAVTPLGMAMERNLGLDWLFKMRGAIPPPPEVVVLGISNRTGQALGLPKAPHHWPRTVHARLVERLIEQNVQAIVFDIDFSRPKQGNEDAILARAIAKANRVVLFERLSARNLRLHSAGKDGRGRAWIEERHPPAGVLATSAKAVGPFPLPKLGLGPTEFWAFKSSVGNAPTTPAIALQLRALTIYKEWLLVLKKARAPGVQKLPEDSSELTDPADFEQLMKRLRRMFKQDALLAQRVGQVLERDYADTPERKTWKLLTALTRLYAGPDYYYINFYGPPGTLPTTPYESLLTAERVESAGSSRDMSHHMVFVGSSDPFDPDQPDRYFTSFTGKDGVDLSGVEIMATAYANLLTRRAIRPASTTTTAISIALFGVVVGGLVFLLPATAGVPSAFVFAGLYAGFTQWHFNQADLWLPLATPVLLQLPAALLIGLMGQYLLQRRKQKHVAQAIRNYVPENLVSDLLERQVDPITVNRVVRGTCLATDMSGFATLAETMAPRELASFMNEYFDALARVLKRASVDVMEFRADMIMCSWIASGPSQAASSQAFDAAIEVSDTIDRFAQEHGALDLTARVGLERGSVYIGHSGGGGRFAYSIIGDTANTAARLESLNKHLGTHILATGSLARDADGLLLRPLGLFRLRGKTDPTSVVEILGRKGCVPAERLDLCQQFAEALAVFQSEDWSHAASLFEVLTKRFVNDGPSRFYLSCSKGFAAEAPLCDDPSVMRMHEK